MVSLTVSPLSLIVSYFGLTVINTEYAFAGIVTLVGSRS
jgi:hypothetical protein